MKFETPAGANPIDRQRVVGQDHARLDGPLKVSGQATYAHEYRDVVAGAAHAVMLGAGVGQGVIASIDTDEAERAPGVLLVLTYKNAPAQSGEGKHDAPQLQGPEIRSFDQSVALVVAETFEQARDAVHLVRIAYRTVDGRFDLEAVKNDGVEPDDAPDRRLGEFEAGFAEAEVSVDVTYRTPDQSHAMMEPQASVGVWRGDALTLYTSNQMTHWARAGVAGTLKIPEEKVRIVTPYVGGGFGSKLQIYGDAILAAIAARKLARPVRIALTRHQIFNHTTHRPATIQRLRIGAGRDGRITAIGHEVWCGNQPGGDPENAADQTELLYAGAHRLTRTRLTRLDLPLGASMRAPGEAAGMLALESAMDELAVALEMDPVELRIRNDIQHDPIEGPERPFSSRRLVECLEEGARRFGWSERAPRPLGRRDGRWWVGMGVASAFRGNLVQPSGARVRLTAEGGAIVETQMTDIGTGSYTILGQVAAEMLGLDLSDVVVRLGDSDFPKAAGSGGSFGANSSTAGLYAACLALRAKLAAAAGVDAEEARFEDGALIAGNRSWTLAELAGPKGLEAEDAIEFGDLTERYAQASFGAHFAEVAVDAATGEVRLRRMLSVCAAGRILNPRTARSQCLGGMTMGLGAALMEALEVDRRHGYFVNHDLAEYHVPVHADVPDLDVVFLDDTDDKSSPIKAKGVGELGICGVGAAVANAVYNACGVRVRDYPLTLDKIIEGLPD